MEQASWVADRFREVKPEKTKKAKQPEAEPAKEKKGEVSDE
jgi:hypothetical protein